MKQTLRLHNRSVTLSPEAYAQRLEGYAVRSLKQVVNTYRAAPPEVQALLMSRPVYVTALAWAQSVHE
jgi:hypothetical protein